MPTPIVKQINEALGKVLSQPDFKEKLSSEAVDFLPMTPESFGAYMKADSARLTALAKGRGIMLGS